MCGLPKTGGYGTARTRSTIKTVPYQYFEIIKLNLSLNYSPPSRVFNASSKCPVVHKKIKKYIFVTKQSAVKLEENRQSNQMLQSNRRQRVRCVALKQQLKRPVVLIGLRLQQTKVFLSKIYHVLFI